MEKDENTVDAANIAELLEVSKQAVYVWAKTDQIPAIKVCSGNERGGSTDVTTG